MGGRPQCLPPLSQEAEREIILSLPAKLNEAFNEACTARTRSDLASSRRDSGWRKVLQWLAAATPATCGISCMVERSQCAT